MNLREKVIHQAVNDALDRLRTEKTTKYKPKKEGRFFTNGVTYEISPAKLVPGGIQYEISSKIPQEVLEQKGQSEKYFKAIKKAMESKELKPTEVGMENIIRSTTINEVKERDYVKCTYYIPEDDLFGDDEVERTVKKAQQGKIDLADEKGAQTIAGRAVIYAARENTYAKARATVADLIEANNKEIKS